jgi:hypothetical protein
MAAFYFAGKICYFLAETHSIDCIPAINSEKVNPDR